LLKFTVQVPDISIGLGVLGFELALLGLIRNVKLKQKDHRKLVEFEQPGKKQNMITVENKVSPLQKLGTILIAPVILVVCFWLIFGAENEGLPLGPDFIKDLVGYIILCSILGGPFVFFISYKILQNLKTKVILTDQKIIKKLPSGKEIQLYWNEIKYITIISIDAGTQLHLTKNKGLAIFDDNNRVHCPSAPNKEKPFLSRDAANLILKKIDLYNISVKGKRELLEEIVQTPHKSQQGPTKPVTQNTTGRDRMPDRPSSAQRPTPK
jgi:hypothetical protein